MIFFVQDVCKTTIFYADKMVERVSREQVRIRSNNAEESCWNFGFLYNFDLIENSQNSLSKTSPQNNNGKFRVSKSLCLAINNIDHVLQYIQPFVAVSISLVQHILTSIQY